MEEEQQEQSSARTTNVKNLANQFVRFAVVGLIAFGIDYGLLVILTELAHIMYLISATISFSTSVVFNYFASMRYVFVRREGMSRRREFLIFLLLSVIGLALNTILLWVSTSIIGIDYRISKIFVTMLVTVFNFVSRRIFLDANHEAAKEAKRIEHLEEEEREAELLKTVEHEDVKEHEDVRFEVEEK